MPSEMSLTDPAFNVFSCEMNDELTTRWSQRVMISKCLTQSDIAQTKKDTDTDQRFYNEADQKVKPGP